MFELDNNKPNKDTLVHVEQDQQGASDGKEDAMYYMPDKFLKPESKQKSGGMFLKIGIVILIIAVLLVGAFAVYILKFRDTDKSEKKDNQEVLNLENSQKPEEEPENIELKTAEGRDKQRIKDINNIVSALSIYFNENRVYPNSLSALSGKLNEIPVNPTPGGENYIYSLNLDKKDYKLIFSLEGPTQNGNLILQSGKYQIKSNGIIELYKEDATTNEDDENNQNGNSNNSNNNSGLLPIPPKGPDADSDDLTNAEEFLFGTEIDNNDSDGDSYLDGNEVANLYDPISNTGKLADNINIVRVFYNESQGYSVLYPTKWMAENKTVDYKESVFYDDKNGDFFKLQVYENPQAQTLKSWYLSFAPGVSPEDLISFKAKTIDGISTRDGLNIYFANSDKIYALSYIFTSETELNYYTTFLMFARSFRPIK